MTIKNKLLRGIFTQRIKDRLLAPVRMALPDKVVLKFGLTTLEGERIRTALTYINGRLLDIGAGNNRLIAQYKNGIGVDVIDWGGGALIVNDSSNLQFSDHSFDTISMLACLNHIPYREAVLREAYRLLKQDGSLIITMISTSVGFISHKVRWYVADTSRKWEPGERYGLSKMEIICMCRRAGFELIDHRRFLLNLNNIYIFRAV
jgi:SAM-dependent methyltransferase